MLRVKTRQSYTLGGQFNDLVNYGTHYIKGTGFLDFKPGSYTSRTCKYEKITYHTIDSKSGGKPYLGKKPKPKEKPKPNDEQILALKPFKGRGRRMPDFACTHEKLEWSIQPCFNGGTWRLWDHYMGGTHYDVPTGNYYGIFIPSARPVSKTLAGNYKVAPSEIDGIFLPEELHSTRDYLSLLDKVVPDTDLLSAGVNIYTILLELAESLTIVQSGVKALQSFFQEGLKKGVSNTYLWYNWGAVPLVGDLLNILDIIQNLNKNIEKWNLAANAGTRKTRAKTFKYNKLGSALHNWAVSQGTGPITYNGTRSNEYELHISLAYRPRLIDEGLACKIWMDRIGLSHPLSGVWEGVPFSWLIDYFVNVGEFLESLEPRIFLPIEVYNIINTLHIRKEVLMTATATGNVPDYTVPGHENMSYKGNIGASYKASIQATATSFRRWIVVPRAAQRVINMLYKPKRLQKQDMTIKHATNLVAFSLAKGKK